MKMKMKMRSRDEKYIINNLINHIIINHLPSHLPSHLSSHHQFLKPNCFNNKSCFVPFLKSDLHEMMVDCETDDMVDCETEDE